MQVQQDVCQLWLEGENWIWNLGSIVQSDRMKRDRFQDLWMKSINASSVIGEQKMPLNLKGKRYYIYP